MWTGSKLGLTLILLCGQEPETGFLLLLLLFLYLKITLVIS